MSTNKVASFADKQQEQAAKLALSLATGNLASDLIRWAEELEKKAQALREAATYILENS